jgi:hypothetical protein
MPQDNFVPPVTQQVPPIAPQNPFMGASSPTQGTPPPLTPKKYGGKKIIATVFMMLALLLGVGTVVTLVQRQQLITGRAWDCSKYRFNVTQEGTVTVQNGSTRSEPQQKAEVYINNVLVKTFDVPALNAGATATLGTVTVPTLQGFTWKVDGTVDCVNTGQYSSTTPTPVAINASCGTVKIYDVNWNQIALADLAKLKSGDVVRIAVSGTATGGSFDKARFTVNGQTRLEGLHKKAKMDPLKKNKALHEEIADLEKKLNEAD